MRIAIIPYRDDLQPWFEQLNLAWIEKHFVVEPLDFEVLRFPEKNILQKGGAILMATYDGEIAGTVALRPLGDGIFEFTKMAVAEHLRGLKIGEHLALAALEKAVEMGATSVVLYSTRILTPAISLYKKLGFKEVPLDAIYKRGDIKMEFPLDTLAKPDVEIRAAGLSDVDTIIRVGIETFRETFEKDNTEADMNLYFQQSFNPAQIEKELKDPNSIFFIAEGGSNVLGYAKIRFDSWTDGLDAIRPMEIERIYIYSKYIGKKVGHLLMETCLNEARKKNCDYVWLGVWTHNHRARTFYEKRGFEVFGDHEFKLGNDIQRDLVMKKSLTAN